MRKSNPANWLLGSSFVWPLSRPIMALPRLLRLLGCPSPAHCAVRLAPSSIEEAGLTVKRAPSNLALLTWRLFSDSPANTTRFHGPSQLLGPQLLRRGWPRFTHTPGTGRALVERMTLLCQPGPHQRSMAPAPNTQLPALPAK